MSNVYMGTDVEDFIFGEGTTYEEACKKEEVEKEEAELMESIQAEMDATGVLECVDAPEVACYRIALENEQNYNAIMNAFMMKEFSVLESTGQEMVYEAVNVKQFFDNIQQMIHSFWKKIKGVFKSVLDRIASYTLSNKAFVKKYGKLKLVKPEGDKEFKGYKFTGAEAKYKAVANLITKAVDVRTVSKISDEAASEVLAAFKDKFDTTKAHMRGAVCGNPANTISSDDFDRQLKLAFYGSEDKVKVELKGFKELISELETAKEAKDKAKTAYKEAESSVKDLLKEVKTAEKVLAKAGERKNAGMKVGRCLTDAINASLTIMSKAMSVQTKAIVEKAMQDRAMAAYYVTHQPKAEPKAESAIEDDLGIVII